MTVVQEHVVLPPSDAHVRDELAEIAELVSAAAPELLGSVAGGFRFPAPSETRWSRWWPRCRPARRSR